MHFEQSFLQKVRFCTNIEVIYLLSIAFVWYAVHPMPSLALVSATNIPQKPHAPVNSPFLVISGLPDRILIPDSSYDGRVVDLQVNPGYYDAATGTWTLSGYQAQFAMTSSLANNFGGETYIYGH